MIPPPLHAYRQDRLGRAPRLKALPVGLLPGRHPERARGSLVCRGAPRVAGCMKSRVFAFRFTPAFRLAGLPFAVAPGTCAVSVSERALLARLGPWTVRSGLDNVAATELVGPFRFVKSAGPAHLSLADHGLTFATNSERGVCIRFHRPVAGIEPFGLLRHPGLTVTVADCAGLQEALER